MQRLRVLVLIISALVGMSALANATAETGQQSNNQASNKKPSQGTSVLILKGKVKSDGGKIIFISRGDRRSWDVDNPDALKGHEGQLIAIKAHLYPDKNSIHVVQVIAVPAPNKDQDSGNNPETRY